MRGVKFDRANDILRAPKGQEESVYDLPIHRSDQSVTSRWKLSWRERIKVLLLGHVYFSCWGHTHPPMVITVDWPYNED